MSSGKSSSDATLPLKAMEAVMDPSTVQKYNHRYTEGYDVSNDELYTVWKQLKELRICAVSKPSETTKSLSTPTCTSKSSEDTDSISHAPSSNANHTSESNFQVPMSDALKDILVYPQKKSKPRTKNPMPSHLSSTQMIEYFEEKVRKKAEKRQGKKLKD